MLKKSDGLSQQLGQHRLAVTIATLFVLLAGSYSVATPLFESPDELWHYPFVWHLARTGQLPVQDPAKPQLWKQEGSQPPLYYALAGLLTFYIPADDLPGLIYPNPHADIGLVSPDGNINIIVHTAREEWPWRGAVLAIHLTRFISVLLGAGTVLTVYALGRALWPEQQSFALLAMAFVAFNPMFLFIAGSVNNDNLITLLASLVLWQLVSIRSNKPSIRRFMSLGLLVGLAALTKISGLGLLALVGLTLLIEGWRQRSGYMAISGNGLVGCCALVIAGWWYWRNFRLYGDWTGTETMVAMMGPRPFPPTMGQLMSEMSGLIRSFWGLFGYFSIPMPAFIYHLLNLFLVAGLVGLSITFLWPPYLKKLPGQLHQACPILLGWIILMAAGLLQWTLRTPASQGRLLFPALAALAIFWAAGWVSLAPARWQILPPLAMFLVSAWAPWGLIRPAYARPPLLTGLPGMAQPLETTFGESIQLLAYEVEADLSPKPGELLPLRLYWRSLKPLDSDYSVFIHLVDEQALILAQRDVFHGPGVYPTSQWRPDTLFRDSYTLQIPRTTLAPTRAHFKVGLYHHQTGLRLLTTSGDDHVRFGQVALQAQPGEFPNSQDLLFEDGIALVGYAIDRQLLGPGEQLILTLYWQGRDKPTADYKVFVHLVGTDQMRIAQHDSEPGTGAAPTSGWNAGQVVIDEHLLTVAPDAPPEAYHLIVGLYEGSTGQRLRLLQNDQESIQADSVILAGVQVVSSPQ